ncbi:MAG TPA: Bax inhibitor-1 family protein [Hydrogenophaga sp.]|nr:Bax inhibitor-1 family protein [Hydrogenophaga sp.]
MNHSIDKAPSPDERSTTCDHVKLRSTCWLLTLTLLSTALGAWIGINLRITEGITGVTAWVIFLIAGFGFTYVIKKARDSFAGWVVLLGFNLFMGVMLSLTLVNWLGFYNTGSALITVFASAAAVLFGIGAVTGLMRRDPPHWIKALFLGLALLLTAAAVHSLFHSSATTITLSVLMGGLLSALMLRETHRIHRAHLGQPRRAAIHVYLNLFSMFRSLSAMVGRTDDVRR